MKKIILLILVLLASQNTYSQDRRIWLDIQFIQNIRLNKWQNNDLNSLLSKPSSSEFRANFNWQFWDNFGHFLDSSVGILSYSENNEFDVRTFPVINFDNYYLDDVIAKNENPYHIRLTLTYGFFYKIKRNKWNILPYIGIGTQMVDAPSYFREIKEKNTNNIYNISYLWFDKKDTESEHVPIGLTARLNFTYKISTHTNLMFGVEYARYLSRANFTIRVEDYYRGTIVNNYVSKGKHMNTLGLSVGVSFR